MVACCVLFGWGILVLGVASIYSLKTDGECAVNNFDCIRMYQIKKMDTRRKQ